MNPNIDTPRDTRPDPEGDVGPVSGPHSGKPGTYTIEEETSIVHHTADGDRILIARRDVQPDAPITTVLARQAARLTADLLLLAVGCEAAAPGVDGVKREWVLAVAKRARAVELMPRLSDEIPATKRPG
jgi:hypothetical protein